MALRSQRSVLSFALFSALLVSLTSLQACDNGDNEAGGGPDSNGDNVADDLGDLIDVNKDGQADTVDVDKDGKSDGFDLDRDRDGKGDVVGLDTDCDGLLDAIDTTGDGKADLFSNKAPPKNPSNCGPAGSGGSGNTAGSSSTAGTSSGAGTSSTGGSGNSGPTQLGMGTHLGTGNSTEQYAESDVYRDGVGYKFIANGWGNKWESHKLSWTGTAFTVEAFAGSVGANYAPAGYPTMFCGQYSEPPKRSGGNCGLPAPITSLQTIKTGWRWKANGNTGQYNAAWDIWLGNGGNLSAYLMVWLRDPPGQQPAGAAALAGATIPGLPGEWTIWVGNVNGHPIVNYVRAEGSDLPELEFDVMAVYKDAIDRKYTLPGSQILSVAIGFEIWQGPVSNLVTEDFYVDVN